MQRVREVEPFGEKPDFSVSFILPYKELLLMIVDKIVFVTDLELRFRTGITNDRGLCAVTIVNNAQLWTADRRAIHICDLTTMKRVKSIALEQVSALVQVGEIVWVAAGQPPSIHRYDSR